MNTIFFIMTTASICLLISTSPEMVLSAMINGVHGSMELAIKLLAIYAVWMSVIKVMQETGISGWVAKLLRPITRKVFKGESDEACEFIGLNLSANMLGIGSVSTPLGIRAIELMDKGDGYCSDNIILFVIINCTSIQLLPTTIIGMRVASSSIAPSDIILPSLIATLVSTIVGIILCRIISYISRKLSMRKRGKVECE